jgi:RNA polymerase sigma factor (sigma-70 family)
MKMPSKKTPVELTAWSDERLVKECLKGNEEAWVALTKKYRNLIYSIPIKYGLSIDDASDIFQQVCLQLLQALPKLQEPRSLAAWLIKVSSHRCYQWAGREHRFQPFDFESETEREPAAQEMPDELIRELERSRILHEAMAEAPPRCRALIRMLFFETPAMSYEEVAQKLGLATGSIGFIRIRCLKRLRLILEKKGFS